MHDQTQGSGNRASGRGAFLTTGGDNCGRLLHLVLHSGYEQSLEWRCALRMEGRVGCLRQHSRSWDLDRPHHVPWQLPHGEMKREVKSEAFLSFHLANNLKWPFMWFYGTAVFLIPVHCWQWAHATRPSQTHLLWEVEEAFHQGVPVRRATIPFHLNPLPFDSPWKIPLAAWLHLAIFPNWLRCWWPGPG